MECEVAECGVRTTIVKVYTDGAPEMPICVGHVALELLQATEPECGQFVYETHGV